MAVPRQSLPQKSSSLTVKLGAPKIPRRLASSVWLRSVSLFVDALDASMIAAGSRPRSEMVSASTSTSAMSRSCAKFALKTARVDSAHQPSSEAMHTTIPREDRGPFEVELVVSAQPLEVTPHVAALGRINVEGGVVPALLREDRPQQQRLCPTAPRLHHWWARCDRHDRLWHRPRNVEQAKTLVPPLRHVIVLGNRLQEVTLSYWLELVRE